MIAQSLLGEFDHEFANLRKTLERVPEDKPDFKPHDKSMSMSRLAGHLAELSGWVNSTLDADGLDLGGGNYTAFVMTTRADLLRAFDANLTKARASLAAASDDRLLGNWSLRNGSTTVFTMPRIAVLRTFVLNHMVHHRAQLGVYLRMNDVPVPSIYGPSADEGQM
jgi:uncharacterized damage-inducible protein DinB